MHDIKDSVMEEENKPEPEEIQETLFRRRIPSVERRIAEIKPGDMRVRITGTVIDKQDNRIVLDDGSGRINIGFDDPVKAEPNQLVRVFGRVIPIEGGVELQGDIIQDMSRLDLELREETEQLKHDTES